MKTVPIIYILFLLTSFQISAAKELDVYKNKLIVIGKLDQKIRTEYTYWNDKIRIDKENLAKLKSLINQYGFPSIDLVGKEAHMYAFLVAQHGVNDIKFMSLFRDELKKRLGTTQVTDKYYAYLYDRINLRSGLKQKYGTQGRCNNGDWEAIDVEDYSQLNSLRLDLGMISLDEFSKLVCKK